MSLKRDTKAGLTGLAKRGACCLVLWLAACGGGTQVEKFVPTRVLAFGDENSVIDDSDGSGGHTHNGRKYTVNGFDTASTPAPSCVINPIWVQSLAAVWGRVFPECNPGGGATSALMLAKNGAKVADLAAQIAGAGSFGTKDLATVFVGANDIIELEGLYTGSNEAELTVQAQARATALAAQIAGIVKAGAKVVFLTIPELGATPYAAQRNLVAPLGVRAGLLTTLSAKFNAQLRTAISNSNSPSFIDGHQGVQVLADELFRSLVLNAGGSGSTFLNASTAICDPAVLDVIDCTTSTLITAGSTPALATGGTIYNYLWADDRHLSPGAHATLGATAANRTNANPL